MNIFATALLIGFVLFWILGAGKAGEEPKLGANLVLYRKNGRCFHVHHWMVFCGLIALVYAARLDWPRWALLGALGFAVGASLEDLRYPDWDVSNEACSKEK